MTVEVFAPAKINLTLHVTGRRPDGYHALDSLVAFADIGDTVRADKADTTRLTIDGPQAAGLSTQNNLVLRAAALARGTATLHLTKRLPPASGIGGGSSDAAATLIALSRLHGSPLPPPDHIVKLGADVPVCLHRRSCRMQGLGEVIIPVPDLPPLDILLVNPGVSVRTPAIFKALAKRDNSPMTGLRPWTDADSFCAWLKTQRNDLYPAAAHLAPQIDTALAALRSTGPLFAAMSGSGATCFGLYAPGSAEAPRARIAKARPDWWTAAGRLTSFPA